MKKGDRAGYVMLQAGFLFGTLYFLGRGLQSGYFLPIVNMSAALAFFAWTLAFVYLVLIGKSRTESFGLILALILFILALGTAATNGRGRDIQAMIRAYPYLLNPYFALHVVSAFFAYASFTVSFVASVLYLVECRELKNRQASGFYHKLPSLKRLERMVSRPLLWGIPLLLITVVSGFVWAKSAFGSFMLVDPKTIVTMMLLGFYGTILWRYWLTAVRGKEIASLSVLSFAFIVAGFITTYLLSCRHNFL
jgi:ABC-type transport system involved in cytochrome c biogenesis permease subunit